MFQRRPLIASRSSLSNARYSEASPGIKTMSLKTNSFLKFFSLAITLIPCRMSEGHQCFSAFAHQCTLWKKIICSYPLIFFNIQTKIAFMKNCSTQQEILLMPNTNFLRHQCVQKIEKNAKRRRHSVSEDIEHACWNGMIYNMLPGMIEKAKSDEKLFLLQVRREDEFLEMELGEDYFRSIDCIFSISPNYFFSEALNN